MIHDGSDKDFATENTQISDVQLNTFLVIMTVLFDAYMQL